MTEPLSIQTILVPQGAEYQAVCRGLRYGKGRTVESVPTVVSIPIGINPVVQYLQTWQPQSSSSHSSVLVMGLCGSLVPHLKVGDSVLYRDCSQFSGNADNDRPLFCCDRTLTDQLHVHLQTRLKRAIGLAKAVTCDRPICTAQEKAALQAACGADVVDMEATAIFQGLQQRGLAVAMLRVVSDDCQHDIPDLTAAISPAGTLLPGQLALSLVRQPAAAVRLIRGSLHGLQALTTLTEALLW